MACCRTVGTRFLETETNSLSRADYFLECSKPLLGMGSTAIPDERINASSTRDKEHKPHFARLHGKKAWCSGKETSPYLEISLAKDYRITGIATQGSGRYMWVTKYEMQYNTSTLGWRVYKVI